MTTKTSREVALWITRTRALIAGLLLAAMMAAGMMMATPARAATTFTVNETVDFPDAFAASNTCDTDVFTGGDQCILRAAIEQANATPGADTINFDIPGTGVKTIVVNAAGLGSLPSIKEQVTIDGNTQPGASPNTKAVGNDAALKIELTQTNTTGPSSVGLDIDRGSGSVIKGLVINRFDFGIFVFSDSAGTHVQGNFIGTNPAGTLDRGNGVGVQIFTDSSNNLVGGTTPAARNVVSGNDASGVVLTESDTNRIQGNYVGTDKSGTKDLGNDGSGGLINGLSVGNTVGDATAAARNDVSGNLADGIDVFTSEQTKVLGNRVGTTADGKGALGNDEDGVSVAAGLHNLIGNGTSGGSNTVAFNGDDGVEVFGISSTDDEISRNSVFSNAGIGIDLEGDVEDALGNTANDPGDADSGPNDLQNKPVIASAKTSSTKTTITGKLESKANQSHTIEFYANPADTNEGKKFVGEKTITTSFDGLRSFTFSPGAKVPVGQTITATATDVSAGDTSEFSGPRTVASS